MFPSSARSNCRRFLSSSGTAAVDRSSEAATQNALVRADYSKDVSKQLPKRVSSSTRSASCRSSTGCPGAMVMGERNKAAAKRLVAPGDGDCNVCLRFRIAAGSVSSHTSPALARKGQRWRDDGTLLALPAGGGPTGRDMVAGSLATPRADFVPDDLREGCCTSYGVGRRR